MWPHAERAKSRAQRITALQVQILAYPGMGHVSYNVRKIALQKSKELIYFTTLSV